MSNDLSKASPEELTEYNELLNFVQKFTGTLRELSDITGYSSHHLAQLAQGKAGFRPAFLHMMRGLSCQLLIERARAGTLISAIEDSKDSAELRKLETLVDSLVAKKLEEYTNGK